MKPAMKKIFRGEIMKYARSRVPFFLMAAVFILASLSAHDAAFAGPKPTPTPLPSPPSQGTATVDGDPSEWDLTNDWYADMKKWGDTTDPIKAKLYLRYDCSTNILYALVLCVDNYKLKTNRWGEEDHCVKIGAFQKEDEVVVVNHLFGLPPHGSPADGTPPDFAWIGYNMYTNTALGWEASAVIPEGQKSIRVHTYASDNNLQSIIPTSTLPGQQLSNGAGLVSSGRSNSTMSIAAGGGGGNTPAYLDDDLPPSLSLMCHSYRVPLNLCCEKKCDRCPDLQGFALVDGIVGDDWDLDEDFYAAMHRSGQSTDKPIESNLYVQYDCLTHTLYVLVLCVDGVVITDLGSSDVHFVKINGNKLVQANDGNDGTPPDFAWVYDGADVIGWEASGTLDPGYYIEFQVHTQVEDGGSQTSSPVPKKGIPLDICCEECPPCDVFTHLGTWFSVSFPGLNDLVPPFLASSYFRSFLWLQDPGDAPMEYPGWCVDLFTRMNVRYMFGDAGEVKLYRTLNADGSSNTAVNFNKPNNDNVNYDIIGEPGNLAKVNWILNNFRRGYYDSGHWSGSGVTWREIQAAIWDLLSIGQNSSGPGKLIIESPVSRGGFISWDTNLANLIVTETTGITHFEFTPWDVVAIIVWCGTEQQVVIIEVPSCYYECLIEWNVLEDPETS